MEPDPDEILHPGSESLAWSKEHEENVKGKKPSAKYTKFSEHARTLISAEKQCSLFCGGKKCKYCTSENWRSDQMAIEGLYSNWVTDNILAIARPSTNQIKKHSIIEQFQKHDIKSLMNLQKPGEHADCGDGLEKAGFSYDPQTFMDNGVFFYNFGWPDYGVAALSTILDMVKVVQFAVSEGKVAVHCHAGLGRTGVVIACYLVYTNRMSGSEAIHYVRSQREGAIQTRGQMECVKEFEKYLKPFRIVFASRAPDSHEFTLQQYLNRQRHILHGYEGRKLKHVPKVIYVVCEKLLQLADRGSSLSKIVTKKLSESSLTSIQQDSLSSETKNSPSLPRNESQSSLQSEKKNVKAKLMKKPSFSFEDLSDEKMKSVLVGEKNNDSDSNSSREPSISSRLNGDVSDMCASSEECFGVVLTVKEVAEAMSTSEVSDDQFDRAEKMETRLNLTEDAWSELAMENDPVVLAQVMWDWLDHLKIPVLRAQDLNSMLQFTDDPNIGLQKLEKCTRYTLEYLVKVINKLKPLDEQTESRVIEKLLSYLTHQWTMISEFSTESNSWAMSTKSDISEINDDHHWGTMKLPMALKLYTFVRNIQQQLSKDTS